MTFTVFQTTTYADILFTSELNTLAISAFPDDETCFVATNSESSKHVTLCTLSTVTGRSLVGVRNEWVKEIGFFRDNC